MPGAARAQNFHQHFQHKIQGLVFARKTVVFKGD